MKTILLAISLMCSLTSIAQYQYSLTLNYHDSLTIAKDVITKIRQEKIICTNITITDNNKIGFNSTANLSKEVLTNIIYEHASITLFEKQKLNNSTYHDYSAKFGGTNCTNAGQVCSNATVSGNNSGFGTQELHPGNRGCLSTNEHQSSWYYINIETPGTIEMVIGTAVDYDWAIWGPYNVTTASTACGNLPEPIRCSYSAFYGNTGLSHVVPYNNGNSSQGNSVTDFSESASGDAWITPINASAGDIYILLVDNYTANNTPFTLTWGGTAGLGCTVVTLAADIVEFSGKNDGESNVIKWSTDSELNNDYFILEHSSDGFNWKAIKKINSTGNNSHYKYDHNEWSKDNYYRLSMVDMDGNSRTHSQLIYIENDPLEIEYIYNSMGQEVDEHYKGFVLIKYTNGRTVKTYR